MHSSLLVGFSLKGAAFILGLSSFSLDPVNSLKIGGRIVGRSELGSSKSRGYEVVEGGGETGGEAVASEVFSNSATVSSNFQFVAMEPFLSFPHFVAFMY